MTSNIVTGQTEYPLQILTLLAAGKVSEQRFVGYDGIQCSVHGAKARGVSLEAAEAGYSVALTVQGSALVTTGEALELQAMVTTDAYGRAVIAHGGEYINGTVLKAQSVIGGLVEIQLHVDHVTEETTTTTV